MTPHLLIITGDMGAGKTTWCRNFIDHIRTQGHTVSGLLSPALFDDGTKTGIALLNLSTGEQRQLARLRTGDSAPAGIATRRWAFDSDVLAWGDSILRAMPSTYLLVIDELGPLELEQGAGWQSALPLLDSGEQYEMACVVIRPSLVPVAWARWPHAVVFTVEGEA